MIRRPAVLLTLALLGCCGAAAPSPPPVVVGAAYPTGGAQGPGGLDMGAVAPPRLFRFAASRASLGRAGVAFVHDQLAPRLGPGRDLRYAVVYVDDDYRRSATDGALEEVERSGLSLAATLPYDLAGVGYPALAARIAGAGTDVLVVASSFEDAVALRRALVAARVPLVASVGTSSSSCMHEFGERLGADAAGLFASDKPDGEVLRPEDTAPAAVARAARAVRLAAGSLPDGSGLDVGPLGSDHRRAVSVIWEWVAPRARAVVWPPAFATHAIEVPGRGR